MDANPIIALPAEELSAQERALTKAIESIDLLTQEKEVLSVEVERLSKLNFKNSIVFEQLKKHFFAMLSDYEAAERWKDSLEHCIDYIDRAQFAERHFKRTKNDIAVAQEWFKKNR